MKRLAPALLLLTSNLALAYSPAAGLWWNPNESGRGYTIDVQDDIMIITAYVYDAGHKATWFLASGTFDNATDTFVGTLGAYSGGQCFGCAYTPATGVAAGTVTIHFSSPESGVLTFPGGQTSIQHQNYAYGSKRDYFYGEWAFSLAQGTDLSTQWVVFNDTYTGSDGTPYISGTEDSVSGTVALGTYDTSENAFVVAIADNNGYSYIYQMNLGDDRRMLGAGTLTPTGVTPGTLTNVASGSRLLFRSELSGGKALHAADPARLQALADDIAAFRRSR